MWEYFYSVMIFASHTLFVKDYTKLSTTQKLHLYQQYNRALLNLFLVQIYLNFCCESKWKHVDKYHTLYIGVNIE